MTSDGDISQVNEKLYIGNIAFAYNVSCLQELKVTHILTVDGKPINLQQSEGVRFHYKFIQCLDLESADLLSQFEECFIFIDTALREPENKVLIHCSAGMSRSATVLIAYLMYSEQMPLEKAYNTVKHCRPIIKPNRGFMEQLRLFEMMGGRIDRNHHVFRQYRMSLLSKRAQTGNFNFKEGDLETHETLDKSEGYYKCAKCRCAVFRSSSILQHSRGEGEAAFDWKSKCSTSSRSSVLDEVCNQSIFIEPIQWMAEHIMQQSGKLNCPKCKMKLGSFIWYGERCPCGAWVAPAFHIQRTKVDEVWPRSLLTPNRPQQRTMPATSNVACDKVQPQLQTDVG